MHTRYPRLLIGEQLKWTSKFASIFQNSVEIDPENESISAFIRISKQQSPSYWGFFRVGYSNS